MASRIFLIEAAAKGVGKTTAVMDMVNALQAQGWRVGGFALQRTYQAQSDGTALHNGYEVFLFHAGASIPVSQDTWQPAPALQRFTDRWGCNEEALDYLVDEVQACAANPDIDIVVVDELGPLLLRDPRKVGRSNLVVDALMSVTAAKKPSIVVIGHARTQFNAANMMRRLKDNYMNRLSGDQAGGPSEVRKLKISGLANQALVETVVKELGSPA